MIDDRKTTQASRYVLGALSIEEQREFEAALQADEKLQLLVKELRGTSLSTPGAAVSLARSGEVVSAPVAKFEDKPTPPRTPAWIVWSPWLLSIVLIVLCVALYASVGNLGQRTHVLARNLQDKDRVVLELKRENKTLAIAAEGFTNAQRRVNDLESQFLKGIEKLGQQAALTNRLAQQFAEANRDLAVATNEVMRLTLANQALEAAVATLAARETNRIATARMIALRPGTAASLSSGTAISGAIYWSAIDQRGVLTADQLPALLPIQSYQLWLISGTNRPVSAGLLPRSPNGAAIQFASAGRVEILRRAFVTIESAFGSASPGDQIVLDSD